MNQTQTEQPTPIQLPEIPAPLGWGVVLVCAVLWKHLLQPRLQRFSTSLESSLQTDREIIEQLTELRLIAHCDRVSLWLPHNGDVFAANHHGWKLSTLHEVCGPGVSPARQHWQSVPVGLLANELHNLIESKQAAFRPENSSTALSNFLTAGGVIDSEARTIATGSGLLGIVLLQWLDDPVAPLAELERQLATIRQLLAQPKPLRQFLQWLGT